VPAGDASVVQALVDHAPRSPASDAEGLALLNPACRILAGTSCTRPLRRLAETHPDRAIRSMALHRLFAARR
jgi:hypothetical protein